VLKLVAVSLILVAGCSSERAPSKAPPKGSPFETFGVTTPKPGDMAPAFELTDTAGASVKLSDAVARGPVVIVFGSFT
jgi:AhpC/TSA family